MIRFLQRQGFVVVRIRGSHHFLQSGQRRTSVPVHAQACLKIGTLHSILRDVELSSEEFAQRWIS